MFDNQGTYRRKLYITELSVPLLGSFPILTSNAAAFTELSQFQRNDYVISRIIPLFDITLESTDRIVMPMQNILVQPRPDGNTSQPYFQCGTECYYPLQVNNTMQFSFRIPSDGYSTMVGSGVDGTTPTFIPIQIDTVACSITVELTPFEYYNGKFGI